MLSSDLDSDPEYTTRPFLFQFSPSPLLSGSLLSLAAQVPAGFDLSPGEVLPGLATVEMGLEGLAGVEFVVLLSAPPDPEGGAWGLWGVPHGGTGAARPP